MDQVKINRDTSVNALKKATTDLSRCRQRDPQPSEQALSRKIQMLEDAWKKFEESHQAYLGKLKPDEGARRELDEAWDGLHDSVEEELEPAHEMLYTLKNPAAVEPAADHRALDQRELIKSEIAQIETKLSRVEATLDDDTQVHSNVSLNALHEIVVAADRRVQENLVAFYMDLLSLCPEERDATSAEMNEKVLALQSLAQDLILKVSTKRNGHAESSSGLGVQVPGAGKTQMYFERRKFPTLDGKKRNFPSFKREWLTCVAPS